MIQYFDPEPLSLGRPRVIIQSSEPISVATFYRCKNETDTLTISRGQSQYLHWARILQYFGFNL